MFKVGLISTYPPERCGIATYAMDIISAVNNIAPEWNFIPIELTHHPVEVNSSLLIQNNNVEHYLRIIQYINENIDLVHIQHEFKIFGKPDGANISVLLQNIKKPIISTLHTISPNLNERREKVFMETIYRSNLVCVFSKEAKSYLIDKYELPRSKILVIPHGVPQVSFIMPEQMKERVELSVPIIFVSAGHLREAKGYEIAISALSLLQNEIPDFRYLILGADHPQNETAQLYRKSLLQLVNDLNLSKNVILINDYLNDNDLIKYLQLADIGLLPYTRLEQSSSGIMALMLACGRPVVSTPFQFAKSQLNEQSGVLSDSITVSDLASAIKSIVNKRLLWTEMSLHNYHFTRAWTWDKVGSQYLQAYNKLIMQKQIA